MTESFWFLAGEDDAERPAASSLPSIPYDDFQPVYEPMRGERRHTRRPSTDEKRVKRQIHRSGNLEDKEAAYGEGSRLPMIPSEKLPSVPQEHVRQKSWLDKIMDDIPGMSDDPLFPPHPGGFDEPWQKNRFEEREQQQRSRQQRNEIPGREKTPEGRAADLIGDLVGPSPTHRSVQDAEEERHSQMSVPDAQMDWFRQRWNQSYEPVGYSDEGRARSRKNTRDRWSRKNELACDHPNCPPWEHNPGYKPQHPKQASLEDHPFWSQVPADAGCPTCGSLNDASFSGDFYPYCEKCGEHFDVRKGVDQARRERGAFNAITPTKSLEPLRQSRNHKIGTILNTQIERLNKGDQIRTPTGQTAEVKGIRPHETDSTLMYLDTDMGTSTVKRGTDFQAVPYNAQQQELPDTGNPMGSGNTAQLPGTAHGPGGPTSGGAPTAATVCPNCSNSGTLHLQGENYVCGVCGYTISAKGSPGGLTFTNQPKGYLPGRRKPGEIPRAHVWAAKYTDRTESQLARRVRQVLGGDQ